MDLEALIVSAVERKASDLHVAAGGPPVIRVDGDLSTLSEEVISHKALEKALFEVMDEAQQAQYRDHREVDFALQVENAGRFRVNVYEQLNGPGVVLRAIPQQIPALDDLGAPEVIRQVSDRSRGLVLVTGPTGSGKSTTLAAMVDHRNRQYPEHILTIEDPIEFVHPSNRALITQREVGHHTVDVQHALRAALREDPDVILVGELRDPDTIRLALTAAETGHLVFGTLHTRTAASSVDRIINTFPGDEQAQVRAMLAESLLAVISQTLLKREGGGRVAGFEIMMAVPAIRNLIRESNLAQIPNALQTGQAQGMQTMAQSLQHLQRQGEISSEVAKTVTDS
jgi:twitching motility protein PilT